MKKVIDLIKEGSLNPDDQTRANAESLLMEMRDRDPATFLYECTKVFRDESLQVPFRMIAGTMLRMSVKEMNVADCDARRQASSSGT